MAWQRWLPSGLMVLKVFVHIFFINTWTSCSFTFLIYCERFVSCKFAAWLWFWESLPHPSRQISCGVLSSALPRLWSILQNVLASLSVSVLHKTKSHRLNVVKNIGLSGLPIMHTRIPINPLKLVHVRTIRSLSLMFTKTKPQNVGLCESKMFTLGSPGSSEETDQKIGGFWRGATGEGRVRLVVQILRFSGGAWEKGQKWIYQNPLMVLQWFCQTLMLKLV